MFRTLILLTIALLAAACSGFDVSGDRNAEALSPSRSQSAEVLTVPSTTAVGTTGAVTTKATPSTTTTTTTTTMADPRVPIVLGFGGDTSFTHGLHARDPLGDVVDILRAPDLTMLNLETVVAEEGVGTAMDKRFVFKSPPSTVELLLEAGVDAVSLANNHTLDYGLPGIERTVELLDQGGVLHAGGGADNDAAYRPLYLQVGGWNLGIVALTRVPCDWSKSDPTARTGAAWTCDPFVEEAAGWVAEAAADTDFTVVFAHWGVELEHCPQPYQRELADLWVASGADLVIGGHPHVFQGVERIGDAWVVHSVGNFAFPSARETSAFTAFVTVELSPDAPPVLAIDPLYIENGRPRPMSAGAAADFRDDVGRWSFGYEFDQTGRAMPTDGDGACS